MDYLTRTEKYKELRESISGSVVEEVIAQMAKNLYKVYRAYHPEGNYLTITFLNGNLLINNDSEDEYKINYFESKQED